MKASAIIAGASITALTIGAACLGGLAAWAGAWLCVVALIRPLVAETTETTKQGESHERN